MVTLIEAARSGSVTEEMRKIASIEGEEPEKIRDRLAKGKVVIFGNRVRTNISRFTGIGEGLSTKVNVNIGASTDHFDVKEEMRKVEIANTYGADTIIDLTDGGDIDLIRREVLKRAIMPVGTVPIYQVFTRGVTFPYF